MFNRKDNRIYFIRLLFTCLIHILHESVTLHDKFEQHWYVALAIRRCSSNRTVSIDKMIHHWQDLWPTRSFPSTCHSLIVDEYSINVRSNIRCLLIVVFIYNCLRLIIFHIRVKHQQAQQIYYARLYRQQKWRDLSR
jgi:hypothetical protein